jgi:Pentapeptide repeats (8 copies)
MTVVKQRTRPETWAALRGRAKHPFLLPLYRVEWVLMWVAYWLSGWAFLEVLEYLGTLSLLLAVVSYFSESGDRVKQKHYQAWLVINSAQSKGGSGGRIDALEELHADGVPLVGVDVSDAFLQGIDLGGADLLRANFRGADVRGGTFVRSRLESADLSTANFRGTNFRKADLRKASLEDADLNGADLGRSDLDGANLSKADLRNADLRDCKWEKISEIKLADIFGIKNAPPGFEKWARENGAVSVESDTDWQALITR